jgi:hypothetical protein
MIGHGGSFGAFDFFEFVDGLGFAVLIPANARCKKILNVGFGHNAKKALSVASGADWASFRRGKLAEAAVWRKHHKG